MFRRLRAAGEAGPSSARPSSPSRVDAGEPPPTKLFKSVFGLTRTKKAEKVIKDMDGDWRQKAGRQLDILRSRHQHDKDATATRIATMQGELGAAAARVRDLEGVLALEQAQRGAAEEKIHFLEGALAEERASQAATEGELGAAAARVRDLEGVLALEQAQRGAAEEKIHFLEGALAEERASQAATEGELGAAAARVRDLEGVLALEQAQRGAAEEKIHFLEGALAEERASQATAQASLVASKRDVTGLKDKLSLKAVKLEHLTARHAETTKELLKARQGLEQQRQQARAAAAQAEGAASEVAALRERVAKVQKELEETCLENNQVHSLRAAAAEAETRALANKEDLRKATAQVAQLTGLTKKMQDEVGQRHDPRGLQLSLDKAVARGEDLDARRKAAERDVAHLRAQLNAATAPAPESPGNAHAVRQQSLARDRLQAEGALQAARARVLELETAGYDAEVVVGLRRQLDEARRAKGEARRAKDELLLLLRRSLAPTLINGVVDATLLKVMGPLLELLLPFTSGQEEALQKWAVAEASDQDERHTLQGVWAQRQAAGLDSPRNSSADCTPPGSPRRAAPAALHRKRRGSGSEGRGGAGSPVAPPSRFAVAAAALDRGGSAAAAATPAQAAPAPGTPRGGPAASAAVQAAAGAELKGVVLQLLSAALVHAVEREIEAKAAPAPPAAAPAAAAAATHGSGAAV
ncbi:hypothetical protein Rsub_08898 [Raphidocelis subcapitata]|uniref:Uncharacterized protein n=1 Tax=Raphidocelis subcapitata TaxID=307507 RepID=A0A2V0PE29_9CHLO|nr:hypothetical protein Rsub_08898 [Raphidocelis subcapitata]|eukprot:GBF96150.1 hypothetical protein Rsub_08898 [Raphidocelis subcapitata]